MLGTRRGSVCLWAHSSAEKANPRAGKWEVEAWPEAKAALTPKIDSGKAARRKSKKLRKVEGRRRVGC